MFNSCTFNSVKYNSACVRQVVPEAPSGGGEEGRFKDPGKRLFRREFIPIVGKKLISDQQLLDIIGKKLIFDIQPINIIGLALLAKQLAIDLKGKRLTKRAEDVFVRGTVKYPIKVEEKICGSKKIAQKHCYIFVRGKRLIASKQLQLLHGQKLISTIQHNHIKGSRKIHCRQNNLIRGQKDITEILKVLDILEE